LPSGHSKYARQHKPGIVNMKTKKKKTMPEIIEIEVLSLVGLKLTINIE